MEQVWFNQGEAARYLRFSLAFFRRHIHASCAIYVATAPRYQRQDLDEFMAARKREGIRPPSRRKRSAADTAAKSKKGARLLAEMQAKGKKRAA